ncbi:MAG TPA: response regulator [Nitrososphaeraceae archaeon]|nr:response regulator [Nitrososphaeraceae archaeon]
MPENWIGDSKNMLVGIVDDDEDITELFHDALCGNIDGIKVVTFNNPVSALEHFTENKENYSLVISGLKMPNLNGLEFLKKIKRLNEKVRTMLISAYDIENDLVFQHYLELGIIDSFIAKRITISRLCQKVRDEFLVYQLAVTLK